MSSSLGKHARDDQGDQESDLVDMPSTTVAETVDGDSSDSEDVGPMPIAPGPDSSDASIAAKHKRRRVVPHEKVYLAQLPRADRYYRSFMHRDTITSVTVTKYTNFILTASADGHLKFWKKQSTKEKEKDNGPGIEFVKHYRAHLSPILACVASSDGLFAATLAADGSAGPDGGMGSIKVFDVENFGLSLCASCSKIAY